jgi:imidazolonepropionase
MNKTGTDSPPGSPESGRWMLIRGARQLLTLRGASGPRCGSAMADLNTIPDGAVLIHEGVIQEVGTTRRLENLAAARLAREYDATGKVVMPAFVDPDIAIATPSSGGPARSDPSETDIRRMSKRRLEGQAGRVIADLARYGVLTVGAHTLFAPDLHSTLKALRLHRSMQSKPVRICSIFAPPAEDSGTGSPRRKNTSGPRAGGVWMAAIFRKRLASLVEISVTSGRVEEARATAVAAAAIGYNIRFRVSGPTISEVLELAYSAGAVALIGPVPGSSDIRRAVANAGCVQIALSGRIVAGNYSSKRRAIDEGIPIALGSGYTREGDSSMNPQFLLFLACHDLGMTAEEAIVAATYNAAYSLRLSHVTGSLAIGKSADICVMDVDDYHELARRAGHNDVSMVMRAGKIVYRRPGLSAE